MRICKRKFNNVNRHVKFTPLAVSNQNIGVLIVAIFSLEIKSTNKYIYILLSSKVLCKNISIFEIPQSDLEYLFLV